MNENEISSKIRNYAQIHDRKIWPVRIYDGAFFEKFLAIFVRI